MLTATANKVSNFTGYTPLTFGIRQYVTMARTTIPKVGEMTIMPV
jgi:hypothetical protein